MTAAKDGIASYIVECGGKGRAFTDEAVADAADRLRNVLRALGMLEGAVTDYGALTYFSNFAWVSATEGGLFQKAVNCGDRLEEGSVLGRYYDAWGNQRSEAKSPHAGGRARDPSGPGHGNRRNPRPYRPGSHASLVQHHGHDDKARDSRHISTRCEAKRTVTRR